MAWKTLGESEITIDKDGSYQTTETVNDGDTIDVIDYINDQGSISNLSPGDYSASGYYSSGTIPQSNVGVLETKTVTETGTITNTYYDSVEAVLKTSGSGISSGGKDKTFNSNESDIVAIDFNVSVDGATPNPRYYIDGGVQWSWGGENNANIITGSGSSCAVKNTVNGGEGEYTITITGTVYGVK